MKELANIMSEDLRTSAAGEKIAVIISEVKLDGRKSLNSQLLPVTEQDAERIYNEISICQEFNQTLSLDAKAHKNLSKCKTFPVSKETDAFSLSTNGKVAQGQESSGSGAAAYKRSVSLPSSSAIVSAMKGGRASNGAMIQGDFRVKWAPEVYDPPSTSMSHTVKSHQQRPKSKKKDKYKYKGKSSRANVGERKHGNRKTHNKTSEPLNISLQGNGDRLVLDCFGKSKVGDILDYSVSQEAKCGSSFLKEASPKVHLPFGEAS